MQAIRLLPNSDDSGFLQGAPLHFSITHPVYLTEYETQHSKTAPDFETAQTDLKLAISDIQIWSCMCSHCDDHRAGVCDTGILGSVRALTAVVELALVVL